MATLAAYDAHADWYEQYVSVTAAGFFDRVRPLVAELLGAGTGRCLDLCCGTGAHAALLRGLGWTPVGVDISAGQLRYAAGRLPVAVGDAAALPVASASVPAVVCLMAHTDLPDYPAVVHEAARVLRPGGRLVHLGVHPCFCGPFADRSDAGRIVVDSGYHRTGRRFDGWLSPQGVRIRVGAWHTKLATLLDAPLHAGLRLVRTAEAGPPDWVPDIFAFAAIKPGG
ncbi:MAG: class I SAM-dependent methyltransferase [Micromonosporaceae bacterium]|nr:class I SAM-dependent methyltransferase [Micromonosporaceae bacterium]